MRHRVHGQSGQRPESDAAHAERDPEQRQAQHDDDTQYGGKRNGGGDVVAVGPDYRRDRGDGRIAADRVAARDQQCHARWQAQQTTYAEAQQDRTGHHAGDADKQGYASSQDGGGADRGPEQDDRDLQQIFGAERDAVMPSVAGRPQAADRGADQDGEHQRLQPRLARDRALACFQRIGGAGHGQAQTDTRQKGEQSIRPPGGCSSVRSSDGGHGGMFLPLHHLCPSHRSFQRIYIVIPIAIRD